MVRCFFNGSRVDDFMNAYSPNNAGQWRAATDEQMQTETLPARPLHQPGSANRQRLVQVQLVSFHAQSTVTRLLKLTENLCKSGQEMVAAVIGSLPS